MDEHINTHYLLEDKSIPNIYLDDLRSPHTIMVENEWNHFKDMKLRNTEYFKIHRLLLGLVERKISLRKNLKVLPYYCRGTKGFMLSDDAAILFPQQVCSAIKFVLEEKDCKVVLFKDMALTLPKNYFKCTK